MMNESKPRSKHQVPSAAYAFDFDEGQRHPNAGIVPGPVPSLRNIVTSRTGLSDLRPRQPPGWWRVRVRDLRPSFTYTAVNSDATIKQAQLLKEQAEAAGMTVEIVTVDQSTLIDGAISGDFEAQGWRNHPGGDPDQQYNWWKTGSPVNFGKFEDPEIDRLLDEGRTTAEGRDEIYEELNERFAEEVHNVWLWYTVWSVATAPDVHGVPGEGPTAEEPFPGIASGHPVTYMWVEQ